MMAQDVLQVVFQYLMPYLAPAIFLFIVILFSDRLIEFVYSSINRSRRRR
ncbi:MAG TPA: hypothetical protein GX525_12055 [Bacilli bacterium]|nr:hypothetical protein [Bacilli bacterium]